MDKGYDVISVLEQMTKTIKMQDRAMSELRKRVAELEKNNKILSISHAASREEVWN